MWRARNLLLCLLLLLCGGCSDSQPKPRQPRVNQTVPAANAAGQPVSEAAAEMAQLASGEGDEADLTRSTPGVNDLHRIPILANLKTLRLRALKVTKDHLDVFVEKCPNLVNLDIFSAEVTPDLLGSLPKLKSLRWLYIPEDTLNDAALEPLRGMLLTRLEIGGTAVTDAGMKVIGTLSALEHLNARELAITDAGVQELEGLSNLNALSLDYTELKDTGLKSLAKLTELSSLWVNRTSITDAGVAELAPLKKMKWFEANCEGLGNGALEVIASWPELETLELRSTGITDEGLRLIGRIKTLRNLRLGKTKVTDAGLQHLSALQLQSLDLSDTDTTSDGVAKLKLGMPDVRVVKYGKPQ